MFGLIAVITANDPVIDVGLYIDTGEPSSKLDKKSESLWRNIDVLGMFTLLGRVVVV